MADGSVESDVSFNGGPILLSTSPETSVELQKQNHYGIRTRY
jgi:hypothetical protein